MKPLLRTLVLALAIASNARAFEGKLEIVITHGSETTPLLYTVGANFLRIEVTGSNAPNPIDIVDLKSGALTLVFPHNHSFVQFKQGNENASSQLPGAPAMPPPPPVVGSQSQPNNMPRVLPTPPSIPPMPTPPGGLPPGVGPQAQGTNSSKIPPMPLMPMMPMMPSEKIELKPTGKKEKILGYACEQYEIKQRGETMEIWTTDKLLPYQPYVRNQPSRFGPRMIEEQWAELLTAKKLFPLRASLRFDEGGEHFHFEAKSITPEKIEDKDGKLFKPPEGYFETQPLPF